MFRHLSNVHHYAQVSEQMEQDNICMGCQAVVDECGNLGRWFKIDAEDRIFCCQAVIWCNQSIACRVMTGKRTQWLISMSANVEITAVIYFRPTLERDGGT